MRGLDVTIGVLAALLWVADGAGAQSGDRSNTTGVFVGLDLTGGSIDVDDPVFDLQESGGGLTLRLGYGFSRLFSLHLGGTATGLEVDGESVTLSHGNLMARFSFGQPAQAFIPYAELGFARRALTVDDFPGEDLQGNPTIGELEVSGGAIALGGGFLYYFTPKWALNLGLTFTAGEFTTVRFNNVSIDDVAEVDGTTARLNLGISWFPMPPR